MTADGIDQDCDNEESCYVDGDGDGVGGTSTATTTSLDCSVSGFDSANTDCDDSDGSVSALQTYYVDGDSDGFGDPNNPVTECSLTPSTGNVTDNTDCDDSSDTTFPGSAPNDSATACMADADGDDYGSTSAPSGGVAGGDCDDAEINTHPYADENAGDGVDSNCDQLENAEFSVMVHGISIPMHRKVYIYWRVIPMKITQRPAIDVQHWHYTMVLLL